MNIWLAFLSLLDTKFVLFFINWRFQWNLSSIYFYCLEYYLFLIFPKITFLIVSSNIPIRQKLNLLDRLFSCSYFTYFYCVCVLDSGGKKCLGFSSNSLIYTFCVFHLLSYSPTKWFKDEAFNLHDFWLIPF